MWTARQRMLPFPQQARRERAGRFRVTVYVPLLIVLLLLSAFFSSSETAFLSLERVRLEHAAREGAAGAARAAQLLATPRRLLSAILLGNNLTNTAAAAVGTVMAAEIVGGGADILVATFAVTVLLVVFAEVAPKSVALHHNLTLARLYALPLEAWSRLMAPVVAGLDALSGGLLSVIGERGEARPSLSLGELRTAIRMGAESGVIQVDESSMLLGALRLQQQQVRGIMTPRVNMVVAAVDEPLPVVAERMGEAGFLRLPVYAGSTDNIVGHVHISDVAAAYEQGRTDARAQEIMREAAFDSERATVARVLATMQQSGVHLVILIDEFGATAGLVTLEDVLEEVVGQIRSESGPPQDELDVRIGGRLYVEGRRPLSDLEQQLQVDLHSPEAETVAGLLLATLRRMPARGESVEQSGYRFTVMSADERRIGVVAVERVGGGEGGSERPP